MNAALEPGVLTHAIEVAIAAAQDAHQLHYIIRSKIPAAARLSPAERKELVKRAWARFAELNAAVPQAYPGGKRFSTP